MHIEVAKFSALGNDYLVIDPNISLVNLDKETIIKICDRHNGVGSDGILYGPIDPKKNSLRIFNPDGSECEKSGNGLRIFSDYLYRNGYASDNRFQINLSDETIDVIGIDQDNGLYKINMGKPTLAIDSHSIRWDKETLIDEVIHVDDNALNSTFVSIGNPHLVVEVEALSAEQAKSLGPLISTMSLFPQRTNVQFCKVLDRKNIQIEIYERGAGYTLASGSSSCAAVSAMYFQNKADATVNIHMPGGVLQAEINDDGNIFLTGESIFIFSGVISDVFTDKCI
jgi:diaminopimelate epimerase